MAALVTQSRMDAHAARGRDLYETPPAAVEALIEAEAPFGGLPHRIWEPACGPGAIVGVLRAHGHDVIATDLVDYGCPDSTARRDFLLAGAGGERAVAIVTNPPYKLAAEFVHMALQLAPKVYMLLRLAFLEGGNGTARRSVLRAAMLDGGELARLHVFRDRLPMMHRDGWDGPKLDKGAIAFAWFVWDRAHEGPIEVYRIRARRPS